jgi:HSP20 family protein
MSWRVQKYPLSDLRSAQEEFSKFFNSTIPQIFRAEEGLLRGSWNPTVDIYENEDNFVLEADLPGVHAKDFDLSIENYRLTLRGGREFKQVDENNYHLIERTYGTFTRTFTLPSTVKVEGVEAEFKDGVLRVTLPKREEVKPRQIQIAVKTDADGSKVKTAEAK